MTSMQTTFGLRVAREDDAEAIGKLAAEFVAEDDTGVVGYLLYHDGYDVDRGGRVLYVADLFVTERARRHGLGRALMERVRVECHARGGQAILWTVYPANVTARRFYEGLGARPTPEQLMSWTV